MKNILYYVEAWDELTPDFRFGAFQDAVYQLDILKKHSPELNIHLLIGDGVQETCYKRNFTAHRAIPTSILHKNKLRKVFKNHSQAAHAFMMNSASTDQLRSLATISMEALGKFKPDLILMHETHAPFLKYAFPEALLLHSMYGITYRMPYPRFTLFDDEGLYQNSILAKHVSEIQSSKIQDEDQQLLAEIRNWFGRQIVPHDPVWPLIETAQSRYDKLLLIPLQVDGYYAFDECCTYSNQVEFLEDVLERIPQNWGVVVTEHSEYNPSVDELTLNRLRRFHPNFIYNSEINRIPYVSQALLAHVDAVITVSSSIAFQSLIFDCPVISAGNSHVNCVATCGIEELRQCFDIYKPGNRDNLLYFLLTRYHLLTAIHVHDGAGLYVLLSQRYQSFKKGLHGLDALAKQNLSDVFQGMKAVSQWKTWTKTLDSKNIPVRPHPVLSQLVNCDAVSFDLFDTLVDRPFVHPHELFQFLEPIVRQRTGNIYFPFHHLRREAERKAREENGHKIEVTLDEIYNNLKTITGFPIQLLDEIKAIEIEMELLLVSPRRGMTRSWHIAGTWGKVRTILTDIYLEKDVISVILERHKLADFNMLFVSATERIRKDDGSVYPEYLLKARRHSPSIRNFLHVGDNPRADGEMARKYGIRTVVIPRAMDQLRSTEFGKAFESALLAPSFDSSIHLGLVANRFFSAPTSSYNNKSLCDGNVFNVGYNILGPFVLGYVQWVIRRMKAHQIDHAYFLARDGYLIMRVYEAIKNVLPDLPNHSYLYCSRRSVMVAGISNERDIFEIATLNFGTTTVQSFLYSRYGLNAKDIPPELLLKHGIRVDGSTLIGYPRDLGLAIRLVIDLKPYIFERARVERITYKKYLNQEGACEKNRRGAFVDIGYSGTMQRKISDISGQNYHGYYMLTHNYVLHHFRDQVFEAWLEEYDSQRAAYKHQFNQHIPLIESLLSSTEGSFVCFHEIDGKLVPEYLNASNEHERCTFVQGLHTGAMAFVDDYLDLFGKFLVDFELSSQVASFPMFQFGSNPSEADVAVFEGLILENMFAGAEFSVIANPYKLLDRDGLLSNSSVEYLINESKWKQGAKVAYKKYMKVESAPCTNDQSIYSEKQLDLRNYQDNRKQRLIRKFRRDPYRYFADARIRALRPLRFLFTNNLIGRISKHLVRTWRI